MAKESPELTAFLECTTTIRTGIYNTVQHDIATKAFTLYLIPDEVHKEVTDNNRWCINGLVAFRLHTFRLHYIRLAPRAITLAPRAAQ